MKLVKAFSSGLVRARHSIKPLIIIWIINLMAISLVAGPFQRFITTSVGNSNAAQMIKEGFNINFWADLGPGLIPAISSLASGVLLLILILFFINIFLTGGLFDSLRENSRRYMTGNFFKSSAKLFFAYLLATLLVMFMILFFGGLVIGVPIIISRASDGDGLTTLVKISSIIFILSIPIFLLIIDYARAWLSANGPSKVFRAIAYGFKATFSGFISSYLFMLLMMAIQGGFVFLASKLLSFNPETGGGLLVLFLLSQVLLFIRLFSRAWRYGGVVAMYFT